MRSRGARGVINGGARRHPSQRVTTETTTEVYDLAGNNTKTTQPIGTVIDRTFDGNHRVTALDITLATGVLGPTDVDYTYDGLGRITQADTEEADGYTSSVERTYNTLGKIETETQVIDGWDSGNGRTITYTWNEKGQKTAVDYPFSGDDITYTRDDLDRIDTIERNSTELVDYTYLGNRVIRKEFPGSEDLRTYDALGRLTEIHHKDLSSGNTLAKFVYTLDDAGMIIGWDRFYYDDTTNTRLTRSDEEQGSQFEYDGAGRLITVLRGVVTADMGNSLATNLTNNDYNLKVEYEYDQVGNRLELELDDVVDQDADFNDMNELTTLNTNSRSYDDNGNYEGSSNTYSYDFKNRLAGFDDGTTPTYEWHYDAFGRAIERERTDTTGNNTRSYYDGNHIVERVRFNATPNPDFEGLRKSYVYGDTIDEVIAMEAEPGSAPDDLHFFHTDHLFSTQLLTDDTGSIEESYRYEEFGHSRVADNTFTLKAAWEPSPLGNIYRFTGRPFASTVSPSGVEQWFDYRARQYASDLGVFLQREIVSTADDTANAYTSPSSQLVAGDDGGGPPCEWEVSANGSDPLDNGSTWLPPNPSDESNCGFKVEKQTGDGDGGGCGSLTLIIHLDTGRPQDGSNGGDPCDIIPVTGGHALDSIGFATPGPNAPQQGVFLQKDASSGSVKQLPFYGGARGNANATVAYHNPGGGGGGESSDAQQCELITACWWGLVWVEGFPQSQETCIDVLACCDC